MAYFYHNIINPFLRVCEKHYDQKAFCINEKFFTYKDFYKIVLSIRRYISDLKNRRELIGLVVNDDIFTYASIFAIWLENKGYVPLHPNHPYERNREIIKLSKITVIFDSRESKWLNLLLKLSDEMGVNQSKPYQKISDNSLAYLLFTSGSTGKPKGVPITKGNLGSFMEAFWAEGFLIDTKDRCLQCFDLTFDVSVQSFLVPLTRGACTYTVPHDQIKYSYVYGLLEEHNLTFGAMAPSLVRFLKPYFQEIHLPAMRYNILTAEASPIDLIDEWSRCIPNAEIYNFYGPTEGTIYCTFYKYLKGRSNKHSNGILSIGKPMKGIQAVILNENKELIKTKEKGELCISGKQITQGYWMNPEKTRDTFVNVILNGYKKLFYKTGDVCYIDEEGDLMYSGRLDYQVKIQGYRVELGEIEYHASKHLNGTTVVALPTFLTTERTELVLFIESEDIDEKVIMDYLKIKIPSYMIPSKVICIKKFPLNSNGKIDRNALKGYLR